MCILTHLAVLGELGLSFAENMWIGEIPFFCLGSSGRFLQRGRGRKTAGGWL